MEGFMHLFISLMLISALGKIEASPRRNSKLSKTFGKQLNIWKREGGTGSVSNVGTAGGNNQITFPDSNPATPKVVCTAPGFFATPGNCFKFHRCVDFSGKGLYFSVFHFDCPAGTIFDPAVNVCNHIWAVTSRPECNGVSPPVVPVVPAVPVVPSVPVVSPSVPAIQTESTVYTTVTAPTQTQESFVSTASVVTQTERPMETESTTQFSTSTVSQFPTTTLPVDENLPVICFRDTIYRIHPVYCNMYYYCESDEIVTFTCPAGLVFETSTRSCSLDAVCPTKIAPLSIKPIEIGTDSTTVLSTESSTEVTTEAFTTTQLAITTESSTLAPVPQTTDISPDVSPDNTSAITVDVTTEKSWEIAPDSLFDCAAPGYYPFEGDCIRFYKCVETDEGKLLGLLYKCPPRFYFDEEKRRCEREEFQTECKRQPQDAHTRLEIETATQLYTHDLAWFFL